jgi:hypothetical protein
MKVGDKVKLLKSIYTSEELAPGQAGIISKIEDTLLFVDMDNGYLPDTGEEEFWCFIEDELEIIE